MARGGGGMFGGAAEGARQAPGTTAKGCMSGVESG